MIKHKKEYGVYHWDTFDNETHLVDESDTIEGAESIVQSAYAGKISSDGADQVDIVDKSGNIVQKFKVR
jgi:hypothetical protein